MIKSEDLFGKREERKDVIKPLIDQMSEFSEKQEYETAKDVLDKIKEELKKPSIEGWPQSYIRIGNIQTIKDVNDLVTSHSIRLNPDNYKFADFLGLLVNVHSRKGEIQGARYIDTDRQRKVVAEEMACLGMTIPESRGGRGGIRKSEKPNRAFLDIAHKINPFIACKEIERREKVMMWKAIEGGKKEEIEKARERLRKYVPKV
jgi:hypothetical protein